MPAKKPSSSKNKSAKVSQTKARTGSAQKPKAGSKAKAKYAPAPKSAKPAARKAKPPAKKKVSHEARAPKAMKSPAIQTPGRAKAPPRVEVAKSEAEKFAIEAARSLHDDKCTEIVVLDVRGKNPMTDFLVVASGTSDRQMRSVLHHVQELGEKLGYAAVRHTSDDRATWLLADFMNVIVHLFEPNTRAHYDIEMMWGDAPRVEWERPGSIRDRAGLNTGESN